MEEIAIASTHISLLMHFIEGIYMHVYIVHPESFRSNTQIAIAFARRNRPHVDRNDEFACVYLRSRAFASTVRDRPRGRTPTRTYIGKVWAWHYLR